VTSSPSPPSATPPIDDVLIIGAGPAGLTTAYHLVHHSALQVRTLEANPVYVGGISRTERFNGFLFDIGGHRFFTKSAEIEKLWHEILPQDFLKKPRLSRIFYKKKFYSYPLKPFEVLMNLGLRESALCMLSYIGARLRPHRNPTTFAQWVSNKFGPHLFKIFFKTYTEKVWGITTDQLSADWAAQRIKGLSLSAALISGLLRPLRSAGPSKIKSLTEVFDYPRLGPGLMWETAARKIQERGGLLNQDRKAVAFIWHENAQIWDVVTHDSHGAAFTYQARHLVSTAPLRDVAMALSPTLASASQAQKLGYRDFITIVLMLKEPVAFKDNWIYIHDPSVKVGRVQNFAAWSPDMLPSPTQGCLGLEYFCFEGDALWSASDDELITLARREIAQLGLIDPDTIEGGTVVRQAKAYPIYDENYAAIVAELRAEITAKLPTLHLIGRNGMHKYNNQDHAMMTGILTARNIIAGKLLFDPWQVNEDAAYHEEHTAQQEGA